MKLMTTIETNTQNLADNILKSNMKLQDKCKCMEIIAWNNAIFWYVNHIKNEERLL